MKKLMYRVYCTKYTGESTELFTSLFESKEQAEFFTEQINKCDSIKASVNKWTWEVKIEE